MCTYIYTCMYTYLCVYIYIWSLSLSSKNIHIYIYIERERERESDWARCLLRTYQLLCVGTGCIFVLAAQFDSHLALIRDWHIVGELRQELLCHEVVRGPGLCSLYAGYLSSGWRTICRTKKSIGQYWKSDDNTNNNDNHMVVSSCSRWSISWGFVYYVRALSRLH